jgi:hypothetical protein
LEYCPRFEGNICPKSFSAEMEIQKVDSWTKLRRCCHLLAGPRSSAKTLRAAVIGHLGANPTIVSYDSNVVKFTMNLSSLVRLKKGSFYLNMLQPTMTLAL